MPKDYIQISLGLPVCRCTGRQEFSVLGWKENESEIVVEVVKSLSYAVCPRCGESTNKVHQYKERPIEDMPIQGKKLWLQIKQRRFKCLSCGRVFTETFENVRPRGHRTVRYEWYLYERGKNRALKDVALEYQVKYTSLRRLWFRCAQEVLDNRPVQHPRQMGIDEFSVAKRYKYRTVLTDLEKHCVVTTLNGRDSAGLRDYLQAIDENLRPGLFVVDIWKGYISAIREVCPDAVIVADLSAVAQAGKFHIIRMVNYALDFTRRVIQRQAKKGKKKIIFRAKHLLLKAHERLTPKEHARLLALFRVWPVLGDAYELKELLRQIYGLKDYEEACSLLRWWCSNAFRSGLPGFKNVAKTYLRWFDIITNYFRYRVTNGFTEGMNPVRNCRKEVKRLTEDKCISNGMNNKIKLDKRMAYGYRNFSNQHLRILALSASA